MNLNDWQRRILMIAIMCSGFFILVLPWQNRDFPIRYNPIFMAPTAESSVHYGRLLIEFAILALVTGVLLVLCEDKQK